MRCTACKRCLKLGCNPHAFSKNNCRWIRRCFLTSLTRRVRRCRICKPSATTICCCRQPAYSCVLGCAKTTRYVNYLAVGGHSSHIQCDLLYQLPVPPPPCAQAAIQKRGRNLGCCLSDSDTRCGGLSSFTSHVSCETIDSCATETVGKIVADFRVSNVC